MSEPYNGPPPRTKSSGAPADPKTLDMFRRGAGGTTPPPSRSPGGQSPAPPPAPDMEDEAAAAADSSSEEELPDGVTSYYDANKMHNIRRSMIDLPLDGRMQALAKRLWPATAAPPAPPKESGTPVSTGGPGNAFANFDRASLFSDKERVAKDRKLSNMVLGILGRITPQNYEDMRKELFDLPIRQSTDEEITDVVNMMYMKAVRPEDELYTELYATLMADLVKHTGVHNVGKTIRKAIIDKCQKQFEQPFRLSDDEKVDANGNPLPQDELEGKTMLLKAKLRANIKFLGHIFISGMVNEKVVNFVLFHLLYGRDEAPAKKRRPEEYELEMFCDLLKKVVKKLSPKTMNEYVPGYLRSLENLIPKVSPRIRFLLMDMQELAKNNWEEKRRPGKMTVGPVKLEEFDKLDAENRARELQEFEHAARRVKQHSPKTPAPRQQQQTFSEPATPVVPLPKKDEIFEVIENFKADNVPSVFESFFKPIPAKERQGYLTHWLMRIVKAVRKSDERKKVGEVIEILRTSNLLAASEIDRSVLDVATKIVVDNLVEDNLRIWMCWCEIVNSCRTVVTPEAHTFLLLALIRGGSYPTPVEQLIDFVEAVFKTPDPHAQHRDPMRRFRPLPALLQYANQLPDPTIAEDEDEEDTGDDDLLSKVIERLQPVSPESGEPIDPEIAIFDTLGANIPIQELADYVRNHASRTESLFVCKVVGAIFTYTRLDPSCAAIDKLQAPLQALVQSHATSDALIVQESFQTWLQLNKTPQRGLARFIERLKDLGIITQKSIEAAQKNIDPRRTREFQEVFGLRTQPAAVPAAGGGGGGGGGRRGR